MTPEQIEERAKDQFEIRMGEVGGDLNLYNGPIAMLCSYPWPPQGIFPPRHELYTDLSDNTHVGRLAIATILVQKFFDTGVKVAEVLENFSTGNYKAFIAKEKNEATKLLLAEKLLGFERPHTIIVVGENQFDPSSEKHYELEHPRVALFNVWPAITALLGIQEALATDDLDIRLKTLEKAESICPLNAIFEEKIYTMIAFKRHGDRSLIREMINVALRQRPNAMMAFELMNFSGERDLLDTYPAEVAEILAAEAPF